MNLTDEIAKLDELHRRGALTAEEFQLAKSRLLAAGDGNAMSQRLAADLYSSNLQSQIDREWEIEKEQYMLTARYGHKYLPDKKMVIPTCIASTAFAVLWTVIASVIGLSGATLIGNPIPLVFPLFGVLFCGFAIANGISSMKKADAYEKAKDQYTARRRAIVEGETNN